MNDQNDYKLDKCLEKLHELDLKIATLQSLVKRMNQFEDKLDRVETKLFRLTITLVVVLSSLAAHYGTELLKIMKVFI